MRGLRRIARCVPRHYYKKFRFGRLTVWVFPFWWSRKQDDTVIGKTLGPITYLWYRRSRDVACRSGGYDAEIRQVVNNVTRPGMGRKRVLASTQYGMGFIITEENEIVLRCDELSHAEREFIAYSVNKQLHE